MGKKFQRNKKQYEIIAEIDKFLQASGIDDNIPPDELASRIFYNKKSLKLTFHGHNLLKNILKEYTFELPTGYQFISSHILYVDRNLTVPYYYTKKKISMFGFDESAFELTMFGDIETYIKAMSNLKNS